MPRVSVIVPVHNGERYLHECLDTILNQTLTDIEVIVVDDASTDATASIVEEYAAADPRVQLLPGPAIGSAGAARNVGLGAARGDYLSFLDADDFFADTLLEELHSKAVADDADVVLSRFRTFNQATGDYALAAWSMRLDYLPETTPFSPQDVGDPLFLSVNPAAWNKLFRTSFIRETGLQFQSLRTTNDAFFTFMALAEARRISYVNLALVNYRVGNAASLRGRLHEAPMDFVPALEAMRDRLVETGRFDALERAWVNQAMEFCLVNLNKATNAASFVKVYRALHDDLFDRFTINGREPSYFLRTPPRRELARVQSRTAEELLFTRMTSAEERARKARTEARAALQEVTSLAASLQEVLSPPPVAADRLPEATAGSEPGDGPDVSVIIPAYNTEQFLRQCVRSVQTQTGVSVEIVCVDDGSPDGSGDLLDGLAANDPRIVVVHRENSGLSISRNVGIERARGRYIVFLDSDDHWLDATGLADLVARAEADALDALMFDAASFREPGVDEDLWLSYAEYYKRSRSYDTPLPGPEKLAELQAAVEYRTSACLVLIRRQFLLDTGLRFYPGITHEDNLFTFALMLHARRAAHVAVPFYARRVRPGSIVTAVERESATRGYYVTYVEMLRMVRDLVFPPAVSTEIAGVMQNILVTARDGYLELRWSARNRLQQVDPRPDAQAVLRQLRQAVIDDAARAAAAPPPRPVRPTRTRHPAVAFARRVAGRGKRALKRVLRRS